MLTINTNVASLNSQRNLSGSQSALSTSLERLSSGLRINSAKDDAAGLAISNRMTSQIRGLDQAKRNANDGISLAQTAEGALGSVSDSLQRIRELAVQSANATNSASDRAALQSEVNQLTSEITRVGNQTQFNGKNLLDGSFQNQGFQIGASANQTITVGKIADSRSSSLGSDTLTADGSITGNVVTGSATVNGVTAVTSATNFTIGTVDGGTSTNITYAGDAGADAIATAINGAASSIGVTATASNSTTLTGLTAPGTVSFTLNGQAISANISNQSDLSSLVSAINGVSGTSGVTAEFTSTSNKGSITLSTTDGRNIGLGAFANSTAGNDSITFGGSLLTEAGTVAAIKTGTVELSSTKGAITTANASAQVFASAGVNNSTFSSVAGIDISSAAGAQSALSVLDAALGKVSSSRADLGAYQNRFNSTITNLQSTSENLSASRSRILDADFAAETAKMSRNQVLQQAGTAMLAQANQLPQQVLSLLR
ncbi:flagellin N-terminal helical domain-containing protein [Vogesella indigofera]|uniref:flagellin N-terminal helical domain-containing protein n=1 Tax=Vogesella indigofera TaxID=45465 RepID=UPI00234E6FFB|nr:flagellin [Vogesella indigofera]MDC7708126.1 flagellin [Vogesella indigofera]